MRILEELKFEFVQIISDSQRKSLKPSPQFLHFIRSSSECMADADTAADLAQSMRSLIKTELYTSWINPLRFFTTEYQLQEKLLRLLDSEAYSLIKLLIRTCNEDRQTISQLERERIARDSRMTAAGTSPRLIADYEQRLRAYADATEINRRRVAELTRASSQLIEENQRLDLLSANQSRILSLLGKLAREESFSTLVKASGLTEDERLDISGYFDLKSSREEPEAAVSLTP